MEVDITSAFLIPAGSNASNTPYLAARVKCNGPLSTAVLNKWDIHPGEKESHDNYLANKSQVIFALRGNTSREVQLLNLSEKQQKVTDRTKIYMERKQNREVSNSSLPI